MVTLIRKWIALKEILTLGMKDSFDSYNPEDILSTLQRFAISRLEADENDTHSYSSLVHGRKEHLRTEMLKASLVRIWELSRNELKKTESLTNPSKRGAWHTVMANCNALYEPYTRAQTELMAA